MKKVFIISPVRNIDKKTEAKIREYIGQLREDKGYMIYWPLEDTDQNDKVGLRICHDNRQAIWQAEEIHLWFDTKSDGSRFDLGMFFAFLMFAKKKLVIINRDEVFSTPDKSFNNIILALEALEKVSQ